MPHGDVISHRHPIFVLAFGFLLRSENRDILRFPWLSLKRGTARGKTRESPSCPGKVACPHFAVPISPSVFYPVFRLRTSSHTPHAAHSVPAITIPMTAQSPPPKACGPAISALSATPMPRTKRTYPIARSIVPSYWKLEIGPYFPGPADGAGKDAGKSELPGEVEGSHFQRVFTVAGVPGRVHPPAWRDNPAYRP